MSYPRYGLMMYDTSSKENKWSLQIYHFIIEYNKNNVVRGSFLRDLWFNYKLEKDAEIYFMIILIKDKKHHREIINILNNNGAISNENNIPNVLDIPIKTDFARCFILTKNAINERMEKMSSGKQNTSKLIITNENCIFKIDVMRYDDIFTISIPSFELN